MDNGLTNSSIPDKIVKLITMTLSNAFAKVKIGEIVSDSFQIQSEEALLINYGKFVRTLIILQ